MEKSQEIQNNTAFAGQGGIHLSWDDTQGSVDAQVSSQPGGLFAFTLEVSGVPRWLNLKLPLGPVGLAPDDVLGMVIDMAGDVPVSTPRVRSQTESGVMDTMLAPRLDANPVRRVRSLLHRVAPGDGLLRSDAFHTLILPLKKRNQKIEIFALNCFVLTLEAA